MIGSWYYYDVRMCESHKSSHTLETDDCGWGNKYDVELVTMIRLKNRMFEINEKLCELLKFF